ncbi:MAG TPA: hypothetical protein VN228_15065 [Pyrinomonadaceae bacterium]|nr:hypothetical protein [Pyrinomonadaceae bacterium]
MFCSGCGAADQSANSYCRRCGTYLQDPSPWRRRDSPERAALWLAVVSVPAFLFCLALMFIIFRITVRGGGPAYFIISYGLCGGLGGFSVACFFYGLRLRRRFLNARGPVNTLSQGEADTARLPPASAGPEAETALLETKPEAAGRRADGAREDGVRQDVSRSR